MKAISIFVPGLLIGALFSAMVLAAPLAKPGSTAAGEFPNRADAYSLAAAG